MHSPHRLTLLLSGAFLLATVADAVATNPQIRGTITFPQPVLAGQTRQAISVYVVVDYDPQYGSFDQYYFCDSTYPNVGDQTFEYQCTPDITITDFTVSATAPGLMTFETMPKAGGGYTWREQEARLYPGNENRTVNIELLEAAVIQGTVRHAEPNLFQTGYPNFYIRWDSTDTNSPHYPSGMSSHFSIPAQQSRGEFHYSIKIPKVIGQANISYQWGTGSLPEGYYSQGWYNTDRTTHEPDQASSIPLTGLSSAIDLFVLETGPPRNYLALAISSLRAVTTGHTQPGPDNEFPEDINNDGKIGLAEAISCLGSASRTP